MVTGPNAGIYVSVNALRSDDRNDRGVPVELLLRQVLESARFAGWATPSSRSIRCWSPTFILSPTARPGVGGGRALADAGGVQCSVARRRAASWRSPTTPSRLSFKEIRKASGCGTT